MQGARASLVPPTAKRRQRTYRWGKPLARLTVTLTLCAAATACEDARPAAAPRTSEEHDALVYRWNSLEQRLEADHDAQRHLPPAPSQSAEVSVDMERAGSSLHAAHRSLEHMYASLPEHARAERREQARAALDEAEALMAQARAILASVDSGPGVAEGGAPTMGGSVPEHD